MAAQFAKRARSTRNAHGDKPGHYPVRVKAVATGTTSGRKHGRYSNLYSVFTSMVASVDWSPTGSIGKSPTCKRWATK